MLFIGVFADNDDESLAVSLLEVGWFWRKFIVAALIGAYRGRGILCWKSGALAQ
jgi:hypothetical protein